MRGWVVGVCAAMLLLAACGGGGGGGGAEEVGASRPDPAVSATIETVQPVAPRAQQGVTFKALAGGGNGVYTYRWDFGDGQTATGEKPQHIYARAGTYKVVMSVTDGRSQVASASTSLAVAAASEWTIDATFGEVSINQPIRFNAKAIYNAFFGNEKVRWDFGDGATSEGYWVEHAFKTKGSYEVKLLVSEPGGETVESKLVVNVVHDGPSALIVSAPDKVVAGQVPTFVAKGSGRGKLVFEWNFGDGFIDLGERINWKIYDKVGPQEVQLRVRDEFFARSEPLLIKFEVVLPEKPSAVLIRPEQVLVNESAAVQFYASWLAPGYTDKVLWDLGDGAVSTEQYLKHTYKKPGAYSVKLTVTDRFGQTATGSATVQVSPRQSLGLFAGSKPPHGDENGSTDAARFYYPQSVVVGKQGDIFVADSANRRIRKISQGRVTTFVGEPARWGCEAPALSADLKLAMDSQGTMYVVDGCSVVKKVGLDGTVSLLAGSASHPIGYLDSVGRAARFGYLSAIAIDHQDNVVVVDGVYIRKITPDGVVSTLADLRKKCWYPDYHGGAPLSIDCGFTAVQVSPSGSIYVAESGGGIYRVDAGNQLVLLAGHTHERGFVDGVAGAARFSRVDALLADATGNLYAADSGNNVLRKIIAGGTVSTLAGQSGAWGGTDGQGSNARFGRPTGLAFDLDGSIVLADRDLQLIRRVALDGSTSTVAGLKSPFGLRDGRGTDAWFARPAGMTVSARGTVYVSDVGNYAVRRITDDGSVTTLARFPYRYMQVFGTHPFGDVPAFGGVAVDADENVYVADSGNNVIRKIAPDGTDTILAGQLGLFGYQDGPGATALFYSPIGVAVDAAKNVYVADTFNHVIRKIDPNGVVSTWVGMARVEGDTDGPRVVVQFSFPTHLALAVDGSLYVADYGNKTVRKVAPDGWTSLIAGKTRTYTNGSSDQLGSDMVFGGELGGLAVNADGDLFLVDKSSAVVHRISSDGMVRRVVGSWWSHRVDLGPLPGSLFIPEGVAVTADGQLLITSGNAVLRTGW
ncbi:PKD domain-containing protein [Roseateles cavernae]|uniref:PKD domain-containing protein n=1 Tax=Roseateles cavernae TaxID=3153578 RepID=UPI0032E37E18